MGERESLCECGHEKRWHPYVGRIASWPTRCLACDCREFKRFCAKCGVRLGEGMCGHGPFGDAGMMGG